MVVPIQAEGVLAVVGEVGKCQTVTFQDPENIKKRYSIRFHQMDPRYRTLLPSKPSPTPKYLGCLIKSVQDTNFTSINSVHGQKHSNFGFLTFKYAFKN